MPPICLGPLLQLVRSRCSAEPGSCSLQQPRRSFQMVHVHIVISSAKQIYAFARDVEKCGKWSM